MKQDEEYSQEQLEKARQAIQAAYQADGETANAERLRILDELQDRTRNTAFHPGDLDQLLEMLQAPGLDANVVVTVFLTLCAAVNRGQIPPAYRERLRQAALTALESDHYTGRQGGVVVLFLMDSREDRQAIAALADDPNGLVSKAAREALERWGDHRAPDDT